MAVETERERERKRERERVSIVCGMTAHGMCGHFKIFESARHFRIEFELGRQIRTQIESRSFAGP